MVDTNANMNGQSHEPRAATSSIDGADAVDPVESHTAEVKGPASTDLNAMLMEDDAQFTQQRQ